MPTATLEQIIEAIAEALEYPSYPVDLEWGDFEPPMDPFTDD